MREYFSYIILIFIFISCKKESKFQVDVSDINVEVTIDRFDKRFYESSPSELEILKTYYPLFFPKNTPDSVWIAKISNKDEQELFAEVDKKYKDLDFLKTDLRTLFKHIKYYNPEFTVPKVYTVLTNIDYRYRVLFAEDLLISLDNYLGAEHPFYADFPQYIRDNLTEKNIVVDVAKNIVNAQISPSRERNFLSKIIFEGKKEYLLKSYLPDVSDEIRFGFSAEKMNWAKVNEEEIWKFFVENKLLYSTDTKLIKRFIENAPFSKFYLQEDRKSPGRIGAWIGYQIVTSYMEKNDVSLQSLFTKKADEIFKQSKYKPRK